MTIHIRLLSGDNAGKNHTYDSNEIHVGRDDKNELRFQDPIVSAQHARIFRDGNDYYIETTRGQNGTYVKGQLIDRPTRLTDGDEISFSANGPKVAFSTTPFTAGTIVVSKQSNTHNSVGNKTFVSTIEETIRRIKGEGRTGVFVKQQLEQLSGKLRVSVRSLMILFVCLALGATLAIAKHTTGLGKIASTLATLGEKLQTALSLVRDTQSKQEALEVMVLEQKKALDQQNKVLEELQKSGYRARKTKDDSIVVDLPAVLFGYDNAELNPEGVEKVTQIADIVKQQAPGNPIRVDGHASREWAERERYNVELSKRRAAAVRDALIHAGIPQNLLTVQALGSSQPLESNGTEEGRRRNRRVEVVIMAGSTTSRSAGV